MGDLMVALIFSSIPGPLQTVHRVEYWGVILAVLAFSGMHVGLDNFTVLKGVARSLGPVDKGFSPLPCHGRDLFAIICSLFRVMGYADQFMVADGSVRQEDLVGNDGAGTAADHGKLRQHDDVIDSRRALLRTRRHWYSIMIDLHKSTVAVSRIEVNHVEKGGTAPDAMTWDEGGIVKPRSLACARATWISGQLLV